MAKASFNSTEIHPKKTFIKHCLINKVCFKHSNIAMVSISISITSERPKPPNTLRRSVWEPEDACEQEITIHLQHLSSEEMGKNITDFLKEIGCNVLTLGNNRGIFFSQ